MSHILIKQPNGKYAIYSVVIDDIISINHTEESLINFYLEREKERLKKEIPKRVKRINDDILQECLTDIEIYHGKQKSEKIKTLLESQDKNADVEML